MFNLTQVQFLNHPLLCLPSELFTAWAIDGLLELPENQPLVSLLSPRHNNVAQDDPAQP